MKLFSVIPAVTAPLTALICGFLFSGCYTLEQGATLIGYLNRAVPIEKQALKSEEDRIFAENVTDIRRFATEELGLSESKNYTRYVELDRDYLAAVLSASAADSFERYEWNFPVVGKVPYKGYFNPEKARKEAQKLQKKGYDTWIRGVDAFSTLGWFRDPLYSYMKKWPLSELAETIIHELLHATVYIKNEGDFNEQLAEFVGSEGARLYLEKRDAAALALADEKEVAAKADRAVFIAFIQNLIADLDFMYTCDISRDEKLKNKKEMIEAAQKRFAENYENLFKTANYRGFSTLPVNNAYLDLYRLYYQEDTYFKDLYKKSGLNLREFIAAAKKITGKEDPRIELEKALNSGN